MSIFRIEINGDFNGNLSWRICFDDDTSQDSTANTGYVMNIARELSSALHKLKNIPALENDIKE